ncbi:hypothetical protein N9Y42_07805, partial [Mariniblastus sp.]|nr:hypothetical protein [Mariniblastus sp.]
MQNTNPNPNPPSNPLSPLGWANRFVPLPPTEFPDEVAIHNSANKPPTREPSKPLESPLNNSSLPCLQDIAGVDPFFTPMQAPQPLPSASQNLDGTVSAQPSMTTPQTNPTTDSGPV